MMGLFWGKERGGKITEGGLRICALQSERLGRKAVVVLGVEAIGRVHCLPSHSLPHPSRHVYT
jgi:hypothetical protein